MNIDWQDFKKTVANPYPTFGPGVPAKPRIRIYFRGQRQVAFYLMSRGGGRSATPIAFYTLYAEGYDNWVYNYYLLRQAGLLTLERG